MNFYIVKIVPLLIGVGCSYIANTYCHRSWHSNLFIHIFLWLIIERAISYNICSTTSVLCVLFFSSILYIGATIDWHTFILPDEGAFLIIIGKIVQILLFADMKIVVELLVMQCIAAVFWGMTFYIIRYVSRGGIGMGDVKWCIAEVFCIPWEYSIYFMVGAFTLGTIYILFLYMYYVVISSSTGKQVPSLRGKVIPFGPFMNGSAITLLIVGGLL